MLLRVMTTLSINKILRYGGLVMSQSLGHACRNYHMWANMTSGHHVRQWIKLNDIFSILQIFVIKCLPTIPLFLNIIKTKWHL